MKKHILLIALLFASLMTQAQVKIGDNPTTIGASSLLELESTNKALLITRVADVTSVTSPVNGMLVYDISLKCVRGYQNGAWTGCNIPTSGLLAIDQASSTLEGSYTAGTATTASNYFSVTLTNNSSSTIGSIDVANAVVLSGPGSDNLRIANMKIDGTNVTDPISLDAGETVILRYRIGGTPTSAGMVIVKLEYNGLICERTTAVN